MASSDLQRPLPIEPDGILYEHLIYKERMIVGYPYYSGDNVLVKERKEARKLIDQFNATDANDENGRQAILDKLLNSKCKGKKIFIEPPFRVDYGYNITVGDHFYQNFDCLFLDCAPITIGDNCAVGPGVHIYTGTHPLNPMLRQQAGHNYAYSVSIGNNVWIGGRAIICPGVKVGDNVVIGAGSVVVKDVPANVVAAGNPAKIIREFNEEMN